MDAIYDEMVRLGGKATASQIAEAARREGICEADMWEAAEAWIALRVVHIEGNALVFAKDAIR